MVAGLMTAVDRAGRTLAGERAVFFGAGAAGGGCALALRAAMREAGLTEQEAARRVLCIDSRGLIVADRKGLSRHKALVAADPELVASWDSPHVERLDLEAVVRHFQPTILAGMSGRPGAFTESVIREMQAHCERPIVFPCSNPTDKAEATPAHLLRWTGGRAIVATGSPFEPVRRGESIHEIGQANNALIFPGAGLGAIAVEARTLPDAAFLAAARALHALAPTDRPTASLFPPLRELGVVSRVVARAVARSLVEAGAAPACSPDEIDARIAALTWEPAYLPYRPAPSSPASAM